MDKDFFLRSLHDNILKQIARKVFSEERITDDEGMYLYSHAPLGFLGMLANHIRTELHGKKTFFNRNFHIEPTNICVFTCTFCSFARRPGEEGGWEYSPEDIWNIARSYIGKSVTEVHIVGGVHPKRGIEYYGEMIRGIKQVLSHIHVKAFTAVELEVMCARSKMTIEEGLNELKKSGLDSLPGGGAEIFHPEIRSRVCATKASSEVWLHIHETAHNFGIPSNCTMLYGHIEKYNHRIDHLRRLRELQDKTQGFMAFIPLKFLRENNDMSGIRETNILEDLRNYAVSRIYLDNIPHIKSYWPMTGKQVAQMSLSFGVDDLDGTIDDTTKIYSLAGSPEQHPVMGLEEMQALIHQAGFEAVERNSFYRELLLTPEIAAPEIIY